LAILPSSISVQLGCPCTDDIESACKATSPSRVIACPARWPSWLAEHGERELCYCPGAEYGILVPTSCQSQTEDGSLVLRMLAPLVTPNETEPSVCSSRAETVFHPVCRQLGSRKRGELPGMHAPTVPVYWSRAGYGDCDITHHSVSLDSGFSDEHTEHGDSALGGLIRYVGASIFVAATKRAGWHRDWQKQRLVRTDQEREWN
jgi:hypothetical protein